MPEPDLDWADVPATVTQAAPRPPVTPAARPSPSDTGVVEVEATRGPRPQPPQVVVAVAAAPAPADRWLRRGKAAAALVAVAGLVAAGFSVADDVGGTPATAQAATVAAAPADCLQAFNGAGADDARAVLATLSTSALVRVQRVDPLPGTLMRGQVCAVTVTDPAGGARRVWADGLEGRDGFVDLSGYPAARRYGAPRAATEANAAVQADGSLRAR